VVAEFPLIVKAYGTPAPAAGTVIDWSIYTGYTNTATDGPVRPDGSTLEVESTNADGSINLGVKDGVYRSVFDLLGTWDPVANSPTLTDGTGNEGDIYFIQGLNGNTYSVDTGSGAQTYTARRFVRYASGVWIPEGDPNYVWQDYFANSAYAFATGETVDATTEPSDWPSRIHFVSSGAGIAGGWPVDNALIVTSKATNARAVQMVYEFGVANPKAYFRSWDGSAWTSFKEVVFNGDDLTSAILKALATTGLVVQNSAGTEKLKVGADTGADVQVTGTLSTTDTLTAETAIGKAVSVNAQTGTSYTLVLGDAGKIVTMTNASANTLTIPTNASVAYATGTVLNVIMGGAGTTSITGDTGVTVNGISAGSGDISAQYQGVALIKTATDTWIASGAIGTVA
jgi:hypothetical protein